MYSGKITIKSGSIVLPTLGKSAKTNGYKFKISKQEYFNDDIQNALIKGFIKLDQKAPKNKYIYIKNISKGNILLSNYGLVAKGKVILVNSKLNDEIRKLISEKKLIKSKNADEDEKSPVDDKMSAVVHRPKSELQEHPQRNKKTKQIKKIDNSIILENGEIPGEHDGIKFVDIT